LREESSRTRVKEFVDNSFPKKEKGNNLLFEAKELC